MRFFLPIIRLAEELPPQSAPEDKLGGLPWGLRPERWPKCRDCGGSQSLLAQFEHHPERFDLGRHGRMLSIFQCNHEPGMCSTWEGGSGANACFVIEPEELVSTLSALPKDAPLVEPEARVIQWVEQEDVVADSLAPQFYSWEGFSKVPDDVRAGIGWSTKLGSVPAWVQSPDESPQGGWRFVGQLASYYRFIEPPVSGTTNVVEDERRQAEAREAALGPNFGGGTAYIFLKDTGGAPEGWFFWQC